MVEAALVAPVFFMVIFGIFELGLVFRTYLTVSNVATQSSRVASVAGTDPEADHRVLRSAEDAIGAIGLENLTVLVVFKASNFDDPVPPGCLTSSVAGLCNRYDLADFALPLNAGHFGCDAVGVAPDPDPMVPAVDHAFCPLLRESALSGNSGAGPDYVGIHVEANHDFISRAFGSSKIIRTTRIVRIEPEGN